MKTKDNELKLYRAWMEEIPKEEIEYRISENEDIETKEQAIEDIYSDSGYWEFEWECLTDDLTELLEEMNPNNNYWECTVSNFGWRNLEGRKTFQEDKGIDFLREILPNCDCHFKIYREGKNTIKINNYHHDSPTGEWYTVSVYTPLIETKLDKSNLEDTANRILESLPHGSGINCDWGTRITSNSIRISNSYHCMNNNGMYDGYSDFTLIFKVGNNIGDFVLQFNCRNSQYLNKKYQLREYLEDEIYYSLED